MRVTNSSCCGLMELHNINTMASPKDVLISLANKQPHSQRSHVVFSDNASGIGSSLAKFIKSNDLGSFAHNTHRNNNSGSQLTVWVWCPNWTTINEKFKGEKPKLKRVNDYY